MFGVLIIAKNEPESSADICHVTGTLLPGIVNYSYEILLHINNTVLHSTDCAPVFNFLVRTVAS